MRRLGILALLALWAGGSGCAGTSRREAGAPSSKDRAWDQAPAPPQAAVTSPPARGEDSVFARSDASGLSKYFPGLRKGRAGPVKVAGASRPSWLGLRRLKATNQVYMTAARPASQRETAEPSLLPVALQVPTDKSVAAASAEVVSEPAPSADGPKPEADPAPSANTPDAVASAAIRPGHENGYPLPQAAGGDPIKVAAGMPEVPTVAPIAKPEAVAAQVAPTGADPFQSLGLPGPLLPASYVRRDTMAARGTTQSPAPAPGPVLASPQVQPTARVAPTPQSSKAPAAKTWKRPCFRRLIRRMCKLGEYANPPTAKPH